MRNACIAASTFALAICAARAQDATTYRYFVLRAVDGEIAIEPREIATSAVDVQVLPCDPGSGNLDVILPVGPGGSASVASPAAGRSLVVVCGRGEIRVQTREADGQTVERPARRIEDLARCDVRVCVSDHAGHGRSFLIERNETVRADDVGPVVDLFAGKAPLGASDWVVCTDTMARTTGAAVQGTANLEIDRWPFARATLPDGQTGWFLVDLGAGTTVVGKGFLPEGTELRDAGMVQYRGAAREILKYAPEGATGTVEGVLGHADLEELRVGDIVFRDATVDVMQELPDLFGRPVAGILGADLLSHARCVSLALRGEHPRLALSDAPPEPHEKAHELPFAIVSTHYTVRGAIGAASIAFLLDSGAPMSVLDAQAATAAGLEARADTARPARGLDAGSAAMLEAGSATLLLGDAELHDVPFHASALSVFDRLRGGNQDVGLLGTAFLARFETIVIDHARRTVTLIGGD